MRVEIKLDDGFKNFTKMLQELPTNVQKKVLQQAVNAAIKEGSSKVKAAAPKSDPDHRSAASREYGHLKSNIEVRTVKRPRPAQKGARIDTGDAFWGNFYELGTRYQAAKPWFGPAFQSAVSSMLTMLSDKLASGIEKEAQKLK